jgi:hypothetical protein
MTGSDGRKEEAGLRHWKIRKFATGNEKRQRPWDYVLCVLHPTPSHASLTSAVLLSQPGVQYIRGDYFYH